MLPKTWIIPPEPSAGIRERLVREMGILPLTAAVLIQRGLDSPETASLFLRPTGVRLRDPGDLPGVAQAGALLAEAIRRREPVAVFGDYDVDGITATALLTEFIRLRGGVCKPHLPNRTAEGYGLNAKFVQAAAASGIRLLVTVDCGVTAVEEVAQARAAGLRVVVTDHHEPGPLLPDADALVDPKAGGPADWTVLAGVGVALQVARAAATALGETEHESLRRHLDLVALGTVADVVPLTGENRQLTRAGLAVINRRGRLGLDALIRAAGLSGALTAMDLAFRLGPRLNAAGRMGEARHSLDLLLTGDADEAERLAQHLNQENSRRQSLERTLVEASEDVLARGPEPGVIVLAGREWPLGVVGLVASKLCEKYHRPCFVLSESQGRLKGSGRSIPGYPLHRVLAEASPLLEKWGGHDMAAGVTLAAANLETFREVLLREAENRLREDQRRPLLPLDAEAELGEITFPLVKELRSLEPTGFGNERPLFAFRRVRLAAPPRVVGERHLKLRLGGGGASAPLDAIGFGLGDRAQTLTRDTLVDIAGAPAENRWNGASLLQVEIKDIRPAQA